MIPKLSAVLIIPFYNESTYIEPTLRSLVRQKVTQRIKWTTIFVNNGSTDNSALIICNYCNKYGLSFSITNEQKKGTVHSRSKGLNEAAKLKPKIIISTDADTVLPKNFIEATCCDMEDSAADILCGKIQKNLVTDLWRRIASKDLYNCLRALRNLEYRLFGPYVFGAYFAIKTNLYTDLPFFHPEEHEQFLGEDILLSHRCHYLGASFKTSTVSVVPHPRKYIATQINELDRFTGNSSNIYEAGLTPEKLHFQKVSLEKERRAKTRLVGFMANRLLWSIADAYVFWRKTDMIHQNARHSMIKALEFIKENSNEYLRIVTPSQKKCFLYLKKLMLNNTKNALKHYLHENSV